MGFFVMWCENCEALGPRMETREQAIAAWNTRTPPKTQAPDTEPSFSAANTLPPQGDLGNSGGLIERLRAEALEQERRYDTLYELYDTAIDSTVALTAKLKLAREGMEDIKADCQPPVHDWVKVRIERIFKAIGGDT